MTTKSELNRLFNEPVTRVEHVERPIPGAFGITHEGVRYTHTYYVYIRILFVFAALINLPRELTREKLRVFLLLSCSHFFKMNFCNNAKETHYSMKLIRDVIPSWYGTMKK